MKTSLNIACSIAFCINLYNFKTFIRYFNGKARQKYSFAVHKYVKIAIIYLLLESDVLHYQCSWHNFWPRTSWIQVPVFGMHAICLSNIIKWSFVLTWKPLVVLMTFPDSSVRPHAERAVRRVSNATELCFFSYRWCINTITKNTPHSNVLAATLTLI